MSDFIFKVNGKEYPVIVIRKKMKNIHYRFIDEKFIVTCPYLVPKFTIENGLQKYASTLIKRSIKVPPIGNDYIYLYGAKLPFNKNGGIIKFTDGEEVSYKDINDLFKKINKIFLKNITNRTEYYANLMHLPKYKVSIRNMKTRYGSNSKQSQSIHYSTILQHYSIEIIDSVVIHELAHILIPNHSKDFYNVVYKYCPQYKALRTKLIRGEYK